jgi:Lipase
MSIIQAYLKRGDHNLLVLDWSDYSIGLYSAVMIRISNISQLFGRVLLKLFDKGLDTKSFHCVGHSFGAHSCGIMSREAYQSSNRRYKVGRFVCITTMTIRTKTVANFISFTESPDSIRPVQASFPWYTKIL